MVSPASSTPPSVLKTGLAFRPFFWLGSVYLICALLAWLFFWSGQTTLQPLGGMLWWHQHELLFGFISAIIAGFLLTAVQSWTARPSLTGPTLWLLVLIWGAARLLIAFPMGINPYWVLFIDTLFLPLVALVMAVLVIKAKKWRNLAFTPILLLLTVANIAMHLGHITAQAQLTQHGAYLSIWLIVGLMVLLGGRVIPFFTSRALHLELQTTPTIYEKSALLSTLFICVIALLFLFNIPTPKWLFSTVLIIFIAANSIRLWYWQPWRCLHHPLLWSLHLSYAFILLGAVFWLLGLWQPILLRLALHLITIGGMLALILSMIARVSLGHTGRPMLALPGFSLAMLCVFSAALIRAIVPAFLPNWILLAYQSSLILCIFAFVWFIAQYTPILWQPRIDHQPG